MRRADGLAGGAQETEVAAAGPDGPDYGRGGVGGAVQMCHQAGARVLATASRSVDRVRSLGAEEVIDYRRGDVLAEAMRLTQGRGVDAVIDLSGVG